MLVVAAPWKIRAMQATTKGIGAAAAAMTAFAAGAFGASRFRRDLHECQLRAGSGSVIADTRCGPIEYASAGSGACVLAVHGAAGGFDQALAVLGPLAQRSLHLVAMSRFGFLRTPLPADASPAAQADAHAALLDALGIGRAAVIGGSAGAPSAMEFAIRHPERCRGLALLVPLAWKPPGSRASAAPAVVRERVLTTVMASDLAYWMTLKLRPNTVIRNVLGTPPGRVHSASPTERERVAALMQSIMPLQARMPGIDNDARIARSLRRLALERIRCPTLIIGVSDDLFGSFAGARYTAEQIAGARFVGFETGGHVWAGHNDEVIAELRNFLERCAGNSGAIGTPSRCISARASNGALTFASLSK